MTDRVLTLPIFETLYLFFLLMVAMVGYTIHGSLFWAVIDALFAPVVVVKWLICKEINMSVLRATFEFLAQ